MLSINSLLEADRDGYQSRLEITESISALSDSISYVTTNFQSKIDAMNENLEQIETRFNTFKDVYLSTGGAEHEAFGIFDEHLSSVKAHTLDIENHIRNKNIGQLKIRYNGGYIQDFELMRNAIDQLTGVSYEQTKIEYEESVAMQSRSPVFLSIFSSAFFLF